MHPRIEPPQRTPEDEARRLLKASGRPVEAVILVLSAGEVCDGQGDEALWITTDRPPLAMTARLVAGRIVKVSRGWALGG